MLIVYLLHLQARQAGIDLLYTSSDHVQETLAEYTLHCDPHKLSQVIRNLISNALKFTPCGGLVSVQYEPIITSSDQNKDGVRGDNKIAVCEDPETVNTIRIRVTDNGVGISKVCMQVVRY